MEDPHTVFPSPLSPAEAESFFATGSDARTAAPGVEPGSVPQLIEDSPGGSGGTAAGGGLYGPGAGGSESQADGCGDAHFECPHCGPVCYGGAAHHARVEDGVFYSAGRGELQARETALAGLSDAIGSLRCSDCKRPRHSTPRHAAGCRFAYTNCPGCAYAGQDHLASCPISTRLRLAADTCCAGVDMPGVGTVHEADCGNMRPVWRASHSLSAAPKQAAPAAEGFHRLFGQLLFAARDLAAERVLQPTGILVKGFCLECGGIISVTASEHGYNCRAGRVLDLVAKICADSPALAEGGGR